MTSDRRVLVGVTYGFSARYLLPTGVLDQLAEVCRPVVGLGWDDDALQRELSRHGAEVVRVPEARLSHDYRMFRRRMALVHQQRLRTPSATIERRLRAASMTPRDRVLTGLRRTKDLAELALPGTTARIEGAEPHEVRAGTNVAHFEALLAELSIDAVMSLTPYHDQDALLLYAARSLGTPSLTSIISFDNPTTRARMLVRSERILVWNRFNREELLRSYHELSPDRIGVVGAPQFDLHQRSDLVMPEPEWRSHLGLPPERPIILYGGGPSILVPHEPRLVEVLDRAIDRGELPDDPYLLVRRHPSDDPGPWRSLGDRLRHGTIEEPWQHGSSLHLAWPTHDDLVNQMSCLAHSAVHVNVCSTMTLDGAVFDRPQIGPRFVPGLDRRGRRQVRDLYEREHWWPITRSGGLRTADDEPQLLHAVSEALRDPAVGRDGRRRMAEELLTHTDGAAGTRLVKEVADFLSNPPAVPIGSAR